MIIKVALGVFLGFLLWKNRDLVGVLLLAGVALMLVGWFLVYIFKNASNSMDQLGLKKDCINLAKDLKLLGFAEDMGIQSLALLLQRHEDSWKIYDLISDIDKFNRRKANGYESDDERDHIRQAFENILKEIKDKGWNPL